MHAHIWNTLHSALEKPLAVLFLLTAISFFLYGNTIPSEFVYDDFFYVGNPAYQQVSFLPKFLFTPGSPHAPFQSAYRPLTYMVMAIQFITFGNHPFGFHLLNISVNAMVMFLIFLVTKKLFKTTSLAVITSILFAFLPIHTENVAYIKALDDILSTALIMFAWYLLLCRKRWLSGCIFFLAILAKELVFFAPILFFLTHPSKTGFEGFRQRIVFFIPYFVWFGVYGLLRFFVFGAAAFRASKVSFIFNPLIDADQITKFWTNWKITGMYLIKTFIPYNLSSSYQYDHLGLISSPFWSWEAWVGMTGIATLLIIAVHPKTRMKPLGVGSLAFIALFIPLPKVLFQVADIFAERWMYGPSIGLAMIAGYLIDRLWQRNRMLSGLVLLVILSFYTSVILPRNLTWRNKKILFTTMVETSPRNVHAYYALAREYYVEGQLDTADRLARTGYAIYQDYPELLYLIGQIAYGKKNYPEAELYFQKAAGLVGRETQVHGMYSLTLAKQGKYTEAIEYIRKNRQLMNEQDYRIQLILGASYHELGDQEKAKQYLGWDERTNDFLHRKELDAFLSSDEQSGIEP